MKTCKEKTDQELIAYFLHKLDVQETEKMQFHLAHCAVCRDCLERMRITAAMLQTDEECGITVTHHRFRTILRMAAAVGGIVLLAGGYYYFHRSPSDVGILIESIDGPVLHSGDSIKTDSIPVDTLLLPSNPVKNE